MLKYNLITKICNYKYSGVGFRCIRTSLLIFVNKDNNPGSRQIYLLSFKNLPSL